MVVLREACDSVSKPPGGPGQVGVGVGGGPHTPWEPSGSFLGKGPLQRQLGRQIGSSWVTWGSNPMTVSLQRCTEEGRRPGGLVAEVGWCSPRGGRSRPPWSPREWPATLGFRLRPPGRVLGVLAPGSLDGRAQGLAE